MLYFWLDYPIQGVPEISKKKSVSEHVENMREIWNVESNKEWNLVLEKLELCSEIEESKETILPENGQLVKTSNF